MSGITSAPHIVVVDDDEALAQLMQECLTDEGYAIAHCARGDEAFAFIRAQRPDAVILDVRLPALGGLGVLYQLRTDPQLAGTPVLLCTGASRCEMPAWEEALARTGVPILFKPFGPANLTAAVRALLPSDAAPAPRRP